MKVDDFINHLNRIQNEDEYIKYISSHIVNNYINYEDKIKMCVNVVDKSKNECLKNIVCGLPLRHLLLYMNIISLYTDISINYNEILSEYNKLNKYGLIIMIVSLIPEKEIDELMILMDMVCYNK